MTRLTIRQWPLPVETGRSTILDAALASGVPFPHGCRTGECGACKSLLLAGDVSMSGYDREVLTDAEKSAGFVLACRAKPLCDVHVSWLGGTLSIDLPIRKMDAQVTNIEQVSPTIKRIFVWPEETLQFAAGQFARLRFADLPARAYSMANTPGEEALEFHIRLIPGGAVSNHIAEDLKVGDTVKIEGPFGNAHLRPEDRSPLVLVAGSSGLAPAKSIIRTALLNQPDRRVHLYFGVRSEEHVYDEGELQGLVARYKNLKVETVLSEPQGETQRRTGMLTDVLTQDLIAHTTAQFYMAGPPEMVNAVSKVVADFGIRKEQIHADPFHAGGQAEQVDEPPRNFNKLLSGFRKLLPVGRLRHNPGSGQPQSVQAVHQAAQERQGSTSGAAPGAAPGAANDTAPGEVVASTSGRQPG
ncbi:2Fe-2S iron-sulfur cluster binding domain-containing protein [Pelagibius litoralis]|uniref:2Fe-2S iron-sulfur cluster binding domain-containing protein n=1 Tax=Pelagibius litoralis TaxID=374515 RepID=A0A967EZF6_9PROT|nr:2Fe-2S iron-sulfur cluster-binding protein [Pelagibius litoralis]NIA70209.1 2Fe-2S iron-sulfur cluster binding domain-containing protein [Pelagibius litoralis]